MPDRLSRAAEALRKDGPKAWAGWVLFVLSFVFYGILAAVMGMSYSAEFKAAAALVLVALGEGSFWVSVVLLGREAVGRFRRMNPASWLRSRIKREP